MLNTFMLQYHNNNICAGPAVDSSWNWLHQENKEPTEPWHFVLNRSPVPVVTLSRLVPRII